MILTCPRCATRYLVDGLKVWTSGRTVQCDACGARWRAVGEGVRETPAAPAPAPLPAAAEVDDGESIAATDWINAQTPPSPAAEAGAVAEDLPFAEIRRRRQDRSAARKAPAKARNPGVWIAVAALVVLVALVLALLREPMVHAFPGLTGIYSAASLFAARPGRPGTSLGGPP
jgi:predicted Zn finger-like uncharacterized protein